MCQIVVIICRILTVARQRLTAVCGRKTNYEKVKNHTKPPLKQRKIFPQPLAIKEKALPFQPSPTLKPAQGGKKVADIDGKASLVRFVLGSLKYSKFQHSSKTKQRQMSMWICYYLMP